MAMDEVTRTAGVAGLFDDREALLTAAVQVRDAGYRRWDCHTPYPVHGLAEAMGLKASPIPYLTVGAAFVGAGLGILMQWWMSAVDYPVRIGGKPMFSWPAFVPIAFELFILFAALATTGALIYFCRLWRWHSPLYNAGVMKEVTTRRFGVFLSAEDEKFSLEGARGLLEAAGCTDVRTVAETEDDGKIL